MKVWISRDGGNSISGWSSDVYFWKKKPIWNRHQSLFDSQRGAVLGYKDMPYEDFYNMFGVKLKCGQCKCFELREVK